MGLRTLGGFLIGRDEAIRAVASTNGSLLLGFFLIVSAGLARNYDHHLLMEEPMWIVGPLAMTLISSCFIYGFAKWRGKIPDSISFFGNYLAFLRCFVLTAPLAWLYGIPVELTGDMLLATKWNVAFLTIVSAWRVYLMVRVLVVLFHFRPIQASRRILIPASLEMGVATFFQSLNIVGVMGGVRLSPSDKFLLNVTGVFFWGSVVIFIGGVLLSFFMERDRAVEVLLAKPHRRWGSSAWALAGLALIGWGWASSVHQPRLSLRQEFSQLMFEGEYEAAAEMLKGRSRADFPSHLGLLQGREYSFHPRVSLAHFRALASRDDWPEWLYQEFLDDLAVAMADPGFRRRQFVYQVIESLEELPYLEDVWAALPKAARAYKKKIYPTFEELKNVIEVN